MLSQKQNSKKKKKKKNQINDSKVPKTFQTQAIKSLTSNYNNGKKRFISHLCRYPESSF